MEKHNARLPEAAKLLGLGVSTLRRHVAARNVKAVRFGRVITIQPAEIERVQREGLPSVPQRWPQQNESEDGL